MHKITLFLWFDDQAEEAANFYVSLFDDAELTEIQRTGAEGAGEVTTVSFTLAGQRFSAINGGPGIPFTEAVSFFVSCEDQVEVDRLWSLLTTDGGRESRSGWVTDRFGFSWNIIPERLGELLRDPDPGRSQRAAQAMLGMNKIDIRALEVAANGLDGPAHPGSDLPEDPSVDRRDREHGSRTRSRGPTLVGRR